MVNIDSKALRLKIKYKNTQNNISSLFFNFNFLSVTLLGLNKISVIKKLLNYYPLISSRYLNRIHEPHIISKYDKT